MENAENGRILMSKMADSLDLATGSGMLEWDMF